MNKLHTLECNPEDPDGCSKKLEIAIENGLWVQLCQTKGDNKSIPNSLLTKGPGVVISSSGSCGGPHQCLHPSSNLDQSAIATGQWLQDQGLDPQKSVILNPLPLHHVSGLMPWWRSRVWGAEHVWLIPSLMRNPLLLDKFCKSLFKKKIGPLLISLVPTQIQRLLVHPAGLHWLQSFDVIWVGGSNLPEELAAKARRKKIQLAPCYGATETAAMITVLAPKGFLEGKAGCGAPLKDVDLRLAKNGALEVKTTRLASALWENGHLRTIRDTNGWWQSGDLAKLTSQNHLYQLEIIGRSDTAIHSGSETIFPEKLELRLLAIAKKSGLALQYIIFLPINDQKWGQRLVALVRWDTKLTTNQHKEQLKNLEKIVSEWHPAERPIKWHECNKLSPNEAGKFQRSKWKSWLELNH